MKVLPRLSLTGLLLHFGCYDLTVLPQVYNFKKHLVLDQKINQEFLKAFLPGMTTEQKKHPSVSPYYEDLVPFRGKLPSALFICGTEDPLLDDSVSMCTKWMISGGDAILKIYPGACHGFIGFHPDALPETGKALEDMKTYIQDCMAKV
jgi:acetyl esterase/lipase